MPGLGEAKARMIAPQLQLVILPHARTFSARMRRDRAIRTKLLLLILFAAIVYLLGNGRVALWDRDEPRYAQTSRQMLTSGDWIVPRLLDEPRLAKPIFIYWCQASAMKLLGDNDFAARLPSSIAMTLTLVFVAAVTYRAVGPERALWTTVVLATSGLAIAAAKMALTDAVLLLFITTSQICLHTIYVMRRRISLTPGSSFLVPLLMWIAAGLAALTKGPVVLGVMFTTMLVFAAVDVGRDWRSGRAWLNAIRWWPRTRPILGLLVIAAICAPWIIAMERRFKDRGGYLLPTLRREIFERARTAQEGHKGPPGYYLLTVWITFFPWSLLLPAILVHAWRRRRLPLIRFCLAATIGPWVMFEIVQTKLPHYLLPVFPALAFLTADLIVRAKRGLHDELTNRGFVRIIAAWCVLILILAAVPWIALKWFALPQPAVWSLMIFNILAAEYARQVWLYFRARRPAHGAAVMGLGVLVLVIVLCVGFLPNAPFLRVSPSVAAILHGDRAHDEMMLDYKEDTLPWYEGGSIRKQRENDFLEKTPPALWPPWLVITQEIWNQTPPEIQQRWQVLGDPVHGWAYSDGGRIVDVLVLRRRD